MKYEQLEEPSNDLVAVTIEQEELSGVPYFGFRTHCRICDYESINLVPYDFRPDLISLDSCSLLLYCVECKILTWHILIEEIDLYFHLGGNGRCLS